MNRRKQKVENDIALFMRQAGRKKDPRFDPNDRAYDHKLVKRLRRMKPEELDDFLNSENF